MAARPIQLDYTTNVDPAIQGNQKLSKSVDSVGKSLDTLSDDAKKTSRAAVDSLKDIDTQSHKTSTNVADDAKTGFGKAEDAASSLGSNVSGNLSQAFNDFDGTAQGAVQGATDAVSGLASIIPGVGGLIGAGLGTALSAGIQIFSQNTAAEAEANKQVISDMYDDFIASGNRYLSSEVVQKAISDIIGDDTKLAAAKNDAKELGVSVQTILHAQAGDSTALLGVQQAILDKQDELRGKQDANTANNVGLSRLYGEQLGALDQVSGRYDKIALNQDTAFSKAQLYLETTNQTADGVSKVGDAINSLPTEHTIALIPNTDSLKKALANLPNTIDITAIVRTPDGVRIR